MLKTKKTHKSFKVKFSTVKNNKYFCWINFIHTELKSTSLRKHVKVAN